ncbi:prefoldin subunit 2-like [Emydura macquarii macquarii]|uniref:prefoldin subunit 2-like n=1 Tax=Emydura macquarii macquarii TaxID=1129001 RepID=UPI00352AB5C5
MADSGKSKTTPTAPCTGKALMAEQMVTRFNQLQQEQQDLASMAAELERELNEHSLVINTLREVGPTCKCNCMLGRVLVEHTIKEVLPACKSYKIIDPDTATAIEEPERNEFWEKHNICLMGEDDQKLLPKESSNGAGTKTSSAGILVS